MATAFLRDRLQPALLDRLMDDRRRYLSPSRRLPASALGQAALACVAGRVQASDGAPADPLLPWATEGVVDDDRRVMNKAQLREAVLRDLTWLFNAVQPLSLQQAEAMPRVAESVLNYGLPALSGLLASRIDIPWLERMLKQAIVCFEPRVVAATLRVKAIEFNSVLDTHNVIEFEISGELWAQPVPIELLLRTKVDLEAGQVVVRDAAAGQPRQPRTT